MTLACREQYSSLVSSERVVLPEPAPERGLAHQAVGVECVSRECRGRRPAARLVVHRSHDRSELREVLLHDPPVVGALQHLGDDLAFDPARQSRIARFPGGGNVHRHVVAAIGCRHRRRHRDARRGQCSQPHSLRVQLREIVIAGSVQAQYVRGTVTILDAERDVLVHHDEAGRPRLDGELAERLHRRRRVEALGRRSIHRFRRVSRRTPRGTPWRVRR